MQPLLLLWVQKSVCISSFTTCLCIVRELITLKASHPMFFLHTVVLGR